MIGIVDDESGAAILQAESAVSGDDAATEALVVGVDEGAGVAFAVGGGEIDRVGLTRQETRRGQLDRRVLADQRSPPGRVRLAQHLVDRHIDLRGVGDQRAGVGKGEAQRLNDQMQRFG